MKPDDLWAHYPVLYHATWGGSWLGIKEHGLHSTRSLLQLYGRNDEEITRLTLNRRPGWVRIDCPCMPDAVIKDQHPMTDDGLKRALPEWVEPWQWYKLLNSLVFFWPTRERLKKMIGSRFYQNVRHDVLIVNTKKLVELECSRIRLSRINSGSTFYNPQKRDLNLFKTFSEFPFESRLQKSGWGNAIAEVCVQDCVKDIEQAVLEVKHGYAPEILKELHD